MNKRLPLKIVLVVIIAVSALAASYLAYGTIQYLRIDAGQTEENFLASDNVLYRIINYSNQRDFFVPNNSPEEWNAFKGAADSYLNNELSVTPVQGGSTSEFVEISAGFTHACGIGAADNKVYCWGWNGNGALGDGTSVERHYPIQIADNSQYIDISAGYHTCGIRANGRVACWGSLCDPGDDIYHCTNPDPAYFVPRLINDASTYISISTGLRSACGIRANGQVFCWLLGPYESIQPVPIADTEPYSKISVANNHICGIHASNSSTPGRVLCWGGNGGQEPGEPCQGAVNGMLGDGTCVDHPDPAFTADTSQYTAISTATYSTCGIRADGRVLCWGSNRWGGLGNGGNWNQERLIPTLTSDSSLYIKISSGHSHTCGIRASGQVMCWGDNNYGEIGDGTFGPIEPDDIKFSPVAIADVNSYSALELGNTRFSCGTHADNQALCWGWNNSGQLGDGTTINRLIPTLVQAQP